ncbi:MAG TPA: hypothetical protein VND45_07540, partial [Thermoanaerobaculia bacterium]|nr:hypothetical protein [Thermoanaerobaculia bacterium]
MDHPVATARAPRTIVIIVVAVVALAIAAAALLPSIRRWTSAERSIDATTLRYAVVTRGELLRDITVQGRVIAALHPTLFSTGQG